MAKTILTIENFKADIDPNFALFIDQLDHVLMENGCTIALKPAKNGHVVSYIDKDSGKTLANFVSRKKGPQVRIYANNIADYMKILDGFPTSMKKQTEKAGVCKRLLDTEINFQNKSFMIPLQSSRQSNIIFEKGRLLPVFSLNNLK